MKLNKDDAQSFALAALKTFDLTNLDISKKEALKELNKSIVSELEELNSEATKKARLEHFKIDGAVLDDYSEKFLCLNENRKIIYGVRHMSGKKDVPFIHFRADFPISSKSEALEIYQRVKSEFTVFNPIYLSFWTRNEIDADFFGSTYMVSTSQKLKYLDSWPKEDDLFFEGISDDSYYDWYKRGYKEFHEDFPHLEKKVGINSLDSMRDSLEQDLLKFVTIGNEKIGLIAAEKNNFLGHEGIYFMEIYIDKKWRGKGLAKAIQRKFIQDFTEGHEFIWGTIDSLNLPSYKTAFSNSRKPIRFECFIKLEEEK